MKNRNMMIYLIAISIIVSAIIICACTIKKPEVLDGPGMINPNAIESFSYYKGGGELGGYLSIELKDEVVTYEKLEENGMPVTTKSIKVDDKLASELASWVESSNARTWTDLEKSDIETLDAPTTSFSIEFYDGLKIDVGDKDILPDGGWQAVRDLISIIESRV